ncbi:MAG: glycosyl hydrolase 115 family protein [Prevotella sp.]|nr:glycosyl hydrolase 115 family protein [Prevotella sp.]
MRRLAAIISMIVMMAMVAKGQVLPQVTESAEEGFFPLVSSSQIASICTDERDYPVVGITAGMLADDVQRVTGRRPAIGHGQPRGAAVVAGTLGKSQLIDGLVKSLKIDVSGIRGKWESFIIKAAEHPKTHAPLLLIIGSDRRGTAFGLTSLSEAIGVSPWYWWADVTPAHKSALYVEPGTFQQGEPSVQYRGIFINDERFGGWARWAEKQYGKVGPETYKRVFELLLRLKANYLWPAMHPGTQAFNADPVNARLADRYAIVMGSSHCEQMLRNNEGEWKAVNEIARAKGEKGLGDFNYITNRKTMQDYWETRVKTNGQYENTYTLGLRGIHDYPMEGANSTAERVKLMQQAIDDQRDMLRRNIKKPLEEIPQVLCTYEEVLDAYHNGLQVPDDVTLLWSDDKHGYCRNLSNPEEQKRKGGAGIYYHLSYHGDPASWIWLSPLSPAFLSTELTKAYTYGARKIWVFNVGDIKPAEKELSFVMDLAWDINRWQPTEAHNYIKHWAEKTFGPAVSQDIARLMARYYRLQAGGKDAHVWFVNYTEQQVAERLCEARSLEAEAELLASRIPAPLQDAYFELISYPIRGAAMLNEYQLLARRSMVCATRQDSLGAMADANRVEQMFAELNEWTRHYNEDIQQAKWREFFNWQPYHWFRSNKIDPPFASSKLIATAKQWPQPRFLSVSDANSCERLRVGASAGMRAIIESEQDADVPLWIEALTPIRNFSKSPQDNVFCRVTTENQTFEASATPINNVWHAPYVGPMWSQVGTLHLKKGINHLSISEVKPDARIDRVFLGLYPPFEKEPRLRLPATAYQNKHDVAANHITRIEGLGYTDGMLVLPFDTPSYRQIADAPYVEYTLDILPSDSAIEIRTLPTLHVYQGRDARYAVQLGDAEPQVFSIHADDFSAEWRWNVLRGYASRSIRIPAGMMGRQTCRIYLLDPGIVLQEILCHDTTHNKQTN